MGSQDIRQFFSPFGQIDAIELPKDPYTGKNRGHSIVEFSSHKEARIAAQSMNGFELMRADNVWREAVARIDGQTVVVTSARVPNPVAVRYACRPQAPEGKPWNLYNRSWLPASPFCSDWNVMPYDPTKNPLPKAP